MGNGLVLADYFACTYCKFLGQTTACGEVEYCKKDCPNGSQIRRIAPEVNRVGCNRFEWNGMPINEVAYREVVNNPIYEGSALRRITPTKGLTSRLTFWDIAENFSWGANFDKEKFDKQTLTSTSLNSSES